MALERVQENVHVTVDMKETCVMSVLNCTLKSKMKILNSNVQVSVKQVLLNLQAILLLIEHTVVVWNSEKGMSPVTKKNRLMVGSCVNCNETCNEVDSSSKYRICLWNTAQDMTLSRVLQELRRKLSFTWPSCNGYSKKYMYIFVVGLASVALCAG